MSDASQHTIRVAIVGCGHVARQVHLPILSRAAGVEIVAIADASADALSEAARFAPSAERHADYREAVARADVDAVVICLPTALHADAAVESLRLGRHVYVEKPIATSRADADRVIDAWRDARRDAEVVGMIGFNYRYNDLYAQLRQRVQRGEVGRVTHVRTSFTTAPHELPAWKRERASGGGALLDLTSHDIDLVRFVLDDDVVEVTADLRSIATEHDAAAVQLRTAKGMTVQMFAAFGTVDEATFEVFGDGGKLTVSRYGSLRVERQGGAAGPARRLLDALPRPGDLRWQLRRRRSPFREPSFGVALGRFIEAVRSDGPASPDLLDGYRSLAVVLAAEQAARDGQPVAVEIDLDADADASANAKKPSAHAPRDVSLA